MDSAVLRVLQDDGILKGQKLKLENLVPFKAEKVVCYLCREI
jgi:hypothetical protein